MRRWPTVLQARRLHQAPLRTARNGLQAGASSEAIAALLAVRLRRTGCDPRCLKRSMMRVGGGSSVERSRKRSGATAMRARSLRIGCSVVRALRRFAPRAYHSASYELRMTSRSPPRRSLELRPVATCPSKRRLRCLACWMLFAPRSRPLTWRGRSLNLKRGSLDAETNIVA